jgi:hypothetical protein
LKKQSQFSKGEIPVEYGEILNERWETNRNDVNISGT